MACPALKQLMLPSQGLLYQCVQVLATIVGNAIKRVLQFSETCSTAWGWLPGVLQPGRQNQHAATENNKTKEDEEFGRGGDQTVLLTLWWLDCSPTKIREDAGYSLSLPLKMLKGCGVVYGPIALPVMPELLRSREKLL